MAIGVAAPRGRSKKKARLAIRVYKTKDAYRHVRQLLKEAKVPMEEVDLATGIQYKAQALLLQVGASVGHFDLGAGTLGAIVEDDSQRYILSNNHVLTNFELGAVGDSIILPSLLDADEHDIVGHLHRTVPLRSGRVDAALATIDPNVVSQIDAWTYRINLILNPTPIDDRNLVTRVAKRVFVNQVFCGARRRHMSEIMLM